MINDNSRKDDLVWVEKYRPQTVSECILSPSIKKVFSDFVEKKIFPNLLLSGGPGSGKTTIARALCNDLNHDVMMINASSERNLDTIRTTLHSFASTVSLLGNKKAIILDEADGLPALSQQALRGLIEEFPSVKFIFTCNYKNKIIPAIQSRTTNIEFTVQETEKQTMMALFLKRVFEILENENIKYDKKVVAQIVKKYYPDNRKILNDIQKYSIGGEIDSGILVQSKSSGADELVKYMKELDLGKARQWIANNSSVDIAVLISEIYDELKNAVSPDSQLVLGPILAEHEERCAFVANTNITLDSMVCRIMSECEFK